MQCFSHQLQNAAKAQQRHQHLDMRASNQTLGHASHRGNRKHLAQLPAAKDSDRGQVSCVAGVAVCSG